MDNNQPIFVRGMSRSGGTLLVTILDAHPKIAMSYELYPHLLEPERNGNFTFAEFEKALRKARKISSLASRLPSSGLGRFITRCTRSDILIDDLLRIVSEFKVQGLGFENYTDRCLFMELCCKVKMYKEKKSVWGIKCTGRYKEYMDVWPKAKFLNIIRDGRDILASQLNTGAFNKTPAQVAKGWVSTHSSFRSMAKKNEGSGLEVFYEKLVTQPELEIRKICNFLDIEFDSSQLEFYKKELTIHKVNHLSSDRIAKPIDDSKIGRWKKELSKHQLHEFLEFAGESLDYYGYKSNEE